MVARQPLLRLGWLAGRDRLQRTEKSRFVKALGIVAAPGAQPVARGMSFVARGIAFDDRFAAAVCDGGLWDLHERSFLAARGSLQPDMPRLDLGLSRVARNIKCPVLITTGERGWLKEDI